LALDYALALLAATRYNRVLATRLFTRVMDELPPLEAALTSMADCNECPECTVLLSILVQQAESLVAAGSAVLRNLAKTPTSLVDCRDHSFRENYSHSLPKLDIRNSSRIRILPGPVM
jgi:hypothetical protein